MVLLACWSCYVIITLTSQRVALLPYRVAMRCDAVHYHRAKESIGGAGAEGDNQGADACFEAAPFVQVGTST